MNRRKFLTDAAYWCVSLPVFAAVGTAAVSPAAASAPATPVHGVTTVQTAMSQHVHLFKYEGGTRCWCGAYASHKPEPVEQTARGHKPNTGTIRQLPVKRISGRG